MAEGAKTWFLIMPDFQLGKDLVAEATPLIEQLGGKVLDDVYFPTGSGDFRSTCCAHRRPAPT